MNLSIYLINHTTKEYAYIGNGDNNGITWVFKDYYWRPNDKIAITCKEQDIPTHFLDILKPVDNIFNLSNKEKQNTNEKDSRFPSFF